MGDLGSRRRVQSQDLADRSTVATDPGKANRSTTLGIPDRYCFSALLFFQRLPGARLCKENSRRNQPGANARAVLHKLCRTTRAE